MGFDRVRKFVGRYPWAITEEAFEALLEIVERRAAGVRLSEEEIEAAIGAARRLPRPAAPGSVAVLPLVGVISHRAGMVADVSLGGTSTEAFAASFRAALADPAVGSIVLDVDSPGGSVHGVEELADTIYQARGTKPIVAVANAVAASAAYWIASQADELVATPSGAVGSIGVIAQHDDVSGAAEREGIRRTYVTAGRYKAEGNPFEPLGEEARSELQRKVDSYYGAFVRAVARGRRTSLEAARGERFGEGRVVLAREALDRGMVDRVETLESTISRLAGRRPGASLAAGVELEQARRRAALEALRRKS